MGGEAVTYGQACLVVDLFLRRPATRERVCSFMEAFPLYDELCEAIEGQGFGDRMEAVIESGSLWLVKKGA